MSTATGPDFARALADHVVTAGPVTGSWSCPCGATSNNDGRPLSGGPVKLTSKADREAQLRDHLAVVIETEISAAEERETAASEPCEEEKHSWDHFRPGQVDSYWMRCHRVGQHDEHENSETGATWTTS